MKQPFVTEILKRIAPRIRAKLIIEPEYKFVGQIIFKNGKKTFFNNTSFNINHLGSVGISKDKGYSAFFLNRMGYKIPEGNTFFSKELNDNIKIKRTIDDGFKYAEKLGFPVILKPNSKSQGVLVAKIHNKTEYYRVAKKILKVSTVMIVERFYEGKDYRVVVLDDKVISAYQRIPLYIVGDGKDNILKLLKKKQKQFEKDGRDTRIEFEDFRMQLKLKRKALTFKSVITKGQKISLLDNANLSTGGSALDVTETIHPKFRDLSIRITKDMGLRLCGVDIITGDITEDNDDYVVIEINGAPGLDNYGSIGKKQQRIVDDLYLQILKSLESER